MYLTSSAFKNNDYIPEKYSYSNNNFSPPLNWDSYPKNTKSFALICNDPDAPSGNWVHWLIYNIPNNYNSLPENIPYEKNLNFGAKQGLNDFNSIGYGGPSPPSGIHRYFFEIFALDSLLNLPVGLKINELLEAIKGHIIDKAQLIGKYKK